jgi:hypothetical protein
MAEDEEEEEEKIKIKSLYSSALTLLAGRPLQSKIISTQGRTDEGQGTLEGRRGEEGRRKRPTVKTKITEKKLKRSLFIYLFIYYLVNTTGIHFTRISHLESFFSTVDHISRTVDVTHKFHSGRFTFSTIGYVDITSRPFNRSRFSFFIGA